MTLPGAVIKKIIRRLLANEDYRVEIVKLIDDDFLQYVIKFFGHVVDANLKNRPVTIDWYKEEFLNANLPKQEVAINAGLNLKTISNMYNTSRKQVVLEASQAHYQNLLNAIQDLAEQSEVDVTLTIKFQTVSVDLNINESLIVINTIAVKRAELRGGYWSTAGKQFEKPLMAILCALFRVPLKHFDQSFNPPSMRETDFYLLGQGGLKHRFEVKLMGKGNPESADVAHARDTKVFVGDKLSDLNKQQLDDANIYWVALRDENGYKRFEQILRSLSVPCQTFEGDVQKALDKILPLILSDDVRTSSTPDIVLRELNRDYGSQLLLDFE